jgi:hypothetical protein
MKIFLEKVEIEKQYPDRTQEQSEKEKISCDFFFNKTIKKEK